MILTRITKFVLLLLLFNSLLILSSELRYILKIVFIILFYFTAYEICIQKNLNIFLLGHRRLESKHKSTLPLTIFFCSFPFREKEL